MNENGQFDRHDLTKDVLILDQKRSIFGCEGAADNDIRKLFKAKIYSK